jgi:hypothetical protein
MQTSLPVTLFQALPQTGALVSTNNTGSPLFRVLEQDSFRKTPRFSGLDDEDALDELDEGFYDDEDEQEVELSESMTWLSERLNIAKPDQVDLDELRDAWDEGTADRNFIGQLYKAYREIDRQSRIEVMLEYVLDDIQTLEGRLGSEENLDRAENSDDYSSQLLPQRQRVLALLQGSQPLTWQDIGALETALELRSFEFYGKVFKNICNKLGAEPTPVNRRKAETFTEYAEQIGFWYTS